LRIRRVKVCWAIEQRLLASQYRFKPPGAHRNIPERIRGMIIMNRCWAGSMVLGVSLCMTNIDTPISTGVRYNGSGCERSVIQRKGAPRSSMETVSTR